MNLRITNHGPIAIPMTIVGAQAAPPPVEAPAPPAVKSTAPTAVKEAVKASVEQREDDQPKAEARAVGQTTTIEPKASLRINDPEVMSLTLGETKDLQKTLQENGQSSDHITTWRSTSLDHEAKEKPSIDIELDNDGSKSLWIKLGDTMEGIPDEIDIGPGNHIAKRATFYVEVIERP